MKHIKKFNENMYDDMRRKFNESNSDIELKNHQSTNESMYRDKCDRCGQSTSGTTTMSIFNEDVICMTCKNEEKNDPEYDAAVKAEYEETMKGNTNFIGSMPDYTPIKRK
jgi:hypothetical protein